jgi:hypothetical protein
MKLRAFTCTFTLILILRLISNEGNSYKKVHFYVLFLVFIRVVIFSSLGERLCKINYVLRKFKAVVGDVLMY